MKYMKAILLLMVCIILCAGCSVQSQDTGNDKEKIDFTVVAKDDMPEEVWKFIEKNKAKPINTTYVAEGYMYVISGYGQMETTGYSIQVADIYQTSDSIYVKTRLIGPENLANVSEARTYPYIVLKMENSDKKVIFK